MNDAIYEGILSGIIMGGILAIVLIVKSILKKTKKVLQKNNLPKIADISDNKKYCPKCGQDYDSATNSYCKDDGSLLVFYSSNRDKGQTNYQVDESPENGKSSSLEVKSKLELPAPVESLPVQAQAEKSSFPHVLLGITLAFIILFVVTFPYDSNEYNELSQVDSSSVVPDRILAVKTANSEFSSSEALDEKNGYKDVKFRMSISEVISICGENRTSYESIEQTTTLHYFNDDYFSIGEFPVDVVMFEFYEDMLFKITIKFSNNINKIYDTFAKAYGTPSESDNWKRDERKIKAHIWDGTLVQCVILSEYAFKGKLPSIAQVEQAMIRGYKEEGIEPTEEMLQSSVDSYFRTNKLNPTWDSIVIYDKMLYDTYLELKESDVERAAKVL